VYSPRGLGIDSTGNLYIADTGGARLVKISPAGDLLEQWTSQAGKLGFGQLVSVAIASNGSIYIADRMEKFGNWIQTVKLPIGRLWGQSTQRQGLISGSVQ